MLRPARALLLPLLALVALLLPVPADAAVKPHKLLCFGLEATHVGTSGDDVFQLREWRPGSGDAGPMVVVGLGGNDTLVAPWASAEVPVYFCGGSGKDGASGTLYAMNGGPGKDALNAQCLPRIRSRSSECGTRTARWHP